MPAIKNTHTLTIVDGAERDQAYPPTLDRSIVRESSGTTGGACAFALEPGSPGSLAIHEGKLAVSNLAASSFFGLAAKPTARVIEKM